MNRTPEAVAELDEQIAIGGHTDIRLLDYLRQPRFVFTVLRDPFDRLVSFYFHHVFPEKETHKRKYRELTRDMSFEDFIAFDRMRPSTDNKFTRVFSGDPMCDRVTRGHLETAKRNLERLDAVLFQDNLDAGIARVAEVLDWTVPEVPRRKVSTHRRQYRGAPPSRDAARANVVMDEELVRFARTLPTAC